MHKELSLISRVFFFISISSIIDSDTFPHRLKTDEHVGLTGVLAACSVGSKGLRPSSCVQQRL